MRQRPPKELRPNCLLTRYPICFVHGLKSIFNCFDYWNGIPKYLKDHGYQVYELNGPWRGPHQLRLHSFEEQILKILNTHPKLHIISHSLGCIDMVELIPKLEEKLSSVTFISPPFGGSPFAELGLIFGRKLFASTNETLTEKNAKKIVGQFKKPNGILIGSIIARPNKYSVSPTVWIQHKVLKKILKKRGVNPENDGLVPLESQLLAQSLGKIFFEFPGDHNQVIGSGPWPQSSKTAHAVFLDHAIFLAEYDFKYSK